MARPPTCKLSRFLDGILCGTIYRCATVLIGQGVVYLLEVSHTKGVKRYRAVSAFYDTCIAVSYLSRGV